MTARSFPIRPIVVVLALQLIGLPGTPAQEKPTAPPLPPIPTRPVDSGDIARDITRQALAIDDPQQRFRVLLTALHSVKGLPPEQRAPVATAVEETAKRIEPQTLIESRRDLMRSDPELAVRIALASDDQRLRDCYFGDVIPLLAAEQPVRALELLKLVKEPKWRCVAVLGYIKVAPVAFDEIRPLIQEAGRAGWKGSYSASFTYYLADGVARFAARQPGEISGALRKNLSPDDAVSTLVQLAWVLSHEFDSPQVARTMVRDAIGSIPQANKPSDAAIRVLQSGYEQLTAEEGAQLFDAYVLPAIARGEQPTEYPLSLLAHFDMVLLVSRAESAATACGRPLIQVLPHAVERAVHGTDAERVKCWLASQEPTPLILRCLMQVPPSAVAAMSEKDSEQVLDQLADFLESAEDDQTKLQAYRLLRVLAAKSDGTSGKPNDERRALLKRFGPDADPRPLNEIPLAELALKQQGRRIAARLNAAARNKKYWKREEQSPWQTLSLIGESSFPEAKRQEFYRQMLQQADGDPTAVSALAGRIAADDYPQALELAWKCLPTPRGPSEYPDYAPLPPPQNMGEMLGRLRYGRDESLRKGNADAVIAALWSLVNRAEPADRDAVRVELTDTLLGQGRLEQALGVAESIDDLPLRLSWMSQVADRAGKQK